MIYVRKLRIRLFVFQYHGWVISPLQASGDRVGKTSSLAKMYPPGIHTQAHTYTVCPEDTSLPMMMFSEWVMREVSTPLSTSMYNLGQVSSWVLFLLPVGVHVFLSPTAQALVILFTIISPTLTRAWHIETFSQWRMIISCLHSLNLLQNKYFPHYFTVYDIADVSHTTIFPSLHPAFTLLQTFPTLLSMSMDYP